MYAIQIQQKNTERVKNKGAKKVVPASFFCPISHELMKDPVIVVETGQTYERNQIEQWLQEHSVDPVTNEKLPKQMLTPNIALRNTIEDFRKTHKVAKSLIGSIDLSNVVLTDYQRNEVKQTFKVSVVGAPSVGKTSLIRKIIYDQFDHNVDTTLGVDIETVAVKLGGRLVKLIFWDTAGQEQFNSLTFNHVRGSNAVLTVFDLSRPQETLKCARKHLLSAPLDDALVFLVGNKSDLVKDEQQRRAAILMGQRFADINSMLLFETSAKSAKNIKWLVISLTRSLLAMYKSVHSRQASTVESIRLRSDDSRTDAEKSCTSQLC